MPHTSRVPKRELNLRLTALLAGGLLACNAERILATARMGGGGSDAAMPGDAGAPLDDAGVDTSDAGRTQPRFGAPVPVQGIRSDGDDVWDPSMTFEGVELYFASSTGAAGPSDIWVSRRISVADPWGPSVVVAELSSASNDDAPDVSADGLAMVFASDRGGDGMRLYASRRRTRDLPWETPQRLEGLGAASRDGAPTQDRAQLALMFASQRGAATVPHLFVASRPGGASAWSGVMEVSALNSAWEDTDPSLYSDGRAVMFASRRNTNGGATDLYEATRRDGNTPFASLEAVIELNTAASEEDPWLTQDGRHILFVSDRSGRRRIYEARR